MFDHKSQSKKTGRIIPKKRMFGHLVPHNQVNQAWSCYMSWNCIIKVKKAIQNKLRKVKLNGSEHSVYKPFERNEM